VVAQWHAFTKLIVNSSACHCVAPLSIQLFNVITQFRFSFRSLDPASGAESAAFCIPLTSGILESGTKSGTTKSLRRKEKHQEFFSFSHTFVSSCLGGNTFRPDFWGRREKFEGQRLKAEERIARTEATTAETPQGSGLTVRPR
jgi:hypothetical protein